MYKVRVSERTHTHTYVNECLKTPITTGSDLLTDESSVQTVLTLSCVFITSLIVKLREMQQISIVRGRLKVINVTNVRL